MESLLKRRISRTRDGSRRRLVVKKIPWQEKEKFKQNDRKKKQRNFLVSDAVAPKFSFFSSSFWHDTAYCYFPHICSEEPSKDAQRLTQTWAPSHPPSLFSWLNIFLFIYFSFSIYSLNSFFLRVILSFVFLLPLVRPPLPLPYSFCFSFLKGKYTPSPSLYTDIQMVFFLI